MNRHDHCDDSCGVTASVVDVAEKGLKKADELALVVVSIPVSQCRSKAVADGVRSCAFRITVDPYSAPLGLTDSLPGRWRLVGNLARLRSPARRLIWLYVFESCSAH
jgi:hypothetical protein